MPTSSNCDFAQIAEAAYTTARYNAGMAGGEQKTKPWQFTLRGLVAITLIVGTSLAYWQERQRRQQLADRLEKRFHLPLVSVWSPRLSDNYSARADIAVAGEVYWPEKRELLGEPRITLQLLRADSLQVVQELPANVAFDEDRRTYSFHNTLKRPRNPPSPLTPGTYLIRAECFDGEVSIATGINALNVVNPPATSVGSTEPNGK